MKRILLLTVVVLSTLGLTLAGFAWWCLATSSGTRWLMASAGRLAGVTLTSTEQHGSLREGLTVNGLRVAWQGGEIQAGTFDLSIRAVNPWSATLAIDHLLIDRLVVQVDEVVEGTAPDAMRGETGDLLAAIPAGLTVTIDRLRISNFVSRNTADPAAETVIARLIAGRYHFAGQHLRVQDFAYHSPYVELDGRFDWDLRHLHLVMTTQVRLPEASADPELFARLKVPSDFPAHLELDGDWNGFNGPVRFGAKQDAGETVWLAAEASGSWQGVRFDDLQGRYLGGDLTGDLELAWVDFFRLHGTLAARALDGGVLIEGVTGKATFDVSGELHVPYDGQPLQASIEAQLHDGQYGDHALHGRAAGQWQGAELLGLEIDLNGDGARLLAKGVPAQRVEIDLEVADLGTLHTELAGQVTARGWLRWKDQSLAGQLDGHGEHLAWRETRVRSLTFQGRRQAGEERFSIVVSGDDWQHDTFHLERLSGEISGTLTAHRLELATEGPSGRFRATAVGTYRAGDWSGQLEQLSGANTPWGTWSMPQPAALAWIDGVAGIDGLKLAGDQGTRLDFDVTGWNSPDRTLVSLAWTGLDLAWLQPYAGPVLLAGRSDGEARYTMSAGRPLSVTARLAARGRVEDEFFAWNYEALDLNFTWDQSGLQLSATANSDAGEELLARATAPAPLQWHWPVTGLTADLRWHRLDLARLGRLLDDVHIEGLGDGSLSFVFAGGQLSRLIAHFSAQGRLLQGTMELGLHSLHADLDWDAEGFQGTARIEGTQGGRVALRLTSPRQPALSWPDSGQISLEIANLSLTALEPLLSDSIELTGFLGGHAEGSWRDKRTLDMTGKVQLLESHFGWSGEEGQIRLPLRDASAEWDWRDDRFSGSFIMNLAEHGDLKGSWQLPLAARMPATLNPEGRMQLIVDGRMQTRGLMSAVGPWLVQDIRGATRINLALQGTWAEPDLRGRIAFMDGGAYLPAAGVQLDNINLLGELAGDRLRIEQLAAHAGPGVLKGQGELVFARWALAEYRLDISGENLQVFNFPELQVLCTPDLRLSGTPDRLSVRGSVLIPVMTIRQSTAAAEVQSSRDVVIAMAEKQRDELGFATDVQVRVELGEGVSVNSAGLETNLAGAVTVTMSPTGEVLAQGEIQLVSGSYRAYGTRLQIRQGGLSYRGGPLTNPDLRIFAARDVGEVLAGVQVTGSAEAPVVTLYSRPTMPERDILGYILMGRALRSDSLDTDLLIMGAGTLLPGDGEGLAKWGIAEIDIQGLFAGQGGVRLRRQFAEKWEVESTLGTESGVDLYYIFEFE